MIDSQVARRWKPSIPTARTWPDRWLTLQAILEDDLDLADCLADAPRRGRPPRITAEQVREGERVVGTDELTGVQASERLQAGRPMAPGHVERREFESVRRGARAFLLGRDVVTGQVFAPTCGASRTKADFAAHIRQVFATDPRAVRWHFAVDDLDIHRSEPGEPGGIPVRRAHKVVFHSTPVPASWHNRIEIRLSIPTREVPRRGSLTLVEDLPRHPSSPTTGASGEGRGAGLAVAREVASGLDVAFLVEDIAQAFDGRWLVIECNDGQESGHPEVSPRGLWQEILRIAKRRLAILGSGPSGSILD